MDSYMIMEGIRKNSSNKLTSSVVLPKFMFFIWRLLISSSTQVGDLVLAESSLTALSEEGPWQQHKPVF